MGDNFSLPSNPTDKRDRLIFTIKTIKNFEFNSHKVPKNLAEKLRNNITNSLQKFLRINKHLNYVNKTIPQLVKSSYVTMTIFLSLVQIKVTLRLLIRGRYHSYHT